MSERAKPFVAYMSTAGVKHQASANVDGGKWHIRSDACGFLPVPVVVTPLLPGDPKPNGDIWLEQNGEECVVCSAPYEDSYGCMVVRVRDPRVTSTSRERRIDGLRPKPALRTFRLACDSTGVQPWGKIAHDSYVSVTAESKEAALAKIEAALEEVDS